MTVESSSDRIKALEKSLAFHEGLLGEFEADDDMRTHVRVNVQNVRACIHAERLEPDDDLRYYLAAHRWAAENGDLRDDNVCGARTRTRNFEDRRYFDPSTAAVLEVLQAEYGDSFYVYTRTYKPHSGPDGVVRDDRFIWEAIALHEDFLPSKSALKYRGSRNLSLRHPYVVLGSGRDNIFMVGDSDNFHNIITTLRYRSPKLDSKLEGVLGCVEVAPDGVRSIPTWTATTVGEGGVSYRECPTFGTKFGFDAGLLLTDGVVVELGNIGRHKVWFDYTRYVNEDGWMERRPSGERMLRVQRTDEPLTDPKERTGCRMRGMGSSQQGEGFVPFKGQLPHCLMVLHINGADYTITIMVDVEGGEIVRAWVEGSCT